MQFLKPEEYSMNSAQFRKIKTFLGYDKIYLVLLALIMLKITRTL